MAAKLSTLRIGVLLTLSLLMLMFPAFPNDSTRMIRAVSASPPLLADPSTVGTSTSAYATVFNSQRKSFYAVGRFWVFWGNGTHMVFASSPDGATWSSQTSVRAIYSGNGRGFSIAFDGTYVHYVYTDTSINHAGYYRRGTPVSDGTITWSAAEQTAITSIPTRAYYYPSVAIDSAGHAFISYTAKNSTTHQPAVTKNADTDGTWTTDAGFPLFLGPGSSAESYALVVGLTNTRVYVLWNTGSSKPQGRLWNGTAWGDQEQGTTSNISSMVNGSVVADGDDIYLAFLTTGTSLVSIKRTYGAGWGSESTIYAYPATAARVTISIDSSTGNLYAFWLNSPTSQHVYYKEYIASLSSWQSGYVDLSAEVALTSSNCLNSFYEAYGGYIGVEFSNSTTSPYQVRFAHFSVGPAAVSNTVSGVFTTNRDGYVNVTVVDTNGVADIQNATMAASTNGGAETFTLMWNQVTNAWSEISDPSGIVTINAGASLNSTTDANTAVLSFKFMFTTGVTDGPVTVTSQVATSMASSSMTTANLFAIGNIHRVYVNLDDGILAQYTIARPIMNTYGINATFYVPCNNVGQDGNMTWTQLATLVSEGNEIGSHSRNHVDLNHVSANQLVDEVTTVKSDFLINHGISVLTFAYPFGEGYNNATVTNAVNAAGYLYARRVQPVTWSRTTGTKTAVTAYNMAFAQYGTLDISMVRSWLNQAYDDNEVILLVHGVGGTSGYNVTTTLFEQTMAYLHDGKFVTPLMSDVGGVIQPIMLTAANPAPAGSFSLSGCRAYPTTISGDGVIHEVGVDPSCSVTVTVPTDGSNTRYRFMPISQNWSFDSCASGTCSVQTSSYYYFSNGGESATTTTTTSFTSASTTTVATATQTTTITHLTTSIAQVGAGSGFGFAVIAIGAGLSAVGAGVVFAASGRTPHSEIFAYGGQYYCGRHRIPVWLVGGEFWCPLENRFLKPSPARSRRAR